MGTASSVIPLSKTFTLLPLVQARLFTSGTHLLGQLRHINRFDSLESGQALETLPGLLLHRDNESILDIAVLREVQRCNKQTNKHILYVLSDWALGGRG
jgi:hypothetical protein